MLGCTLVACISLGKDRAHCPRARLSPSPGWGGSCPLPGTHLVQAWLCNSRASSWERPLRGETRLCISLYPHSLIPPHDGASVNVILCALWTPLVLLHRNLPSQPTALFFFFNKFILQVFLNPTDKFLLCVLPLSMDMSRLHILYSVSCCGQQNCCSWPAGVLPVSFVLLSPPY